MSVSAHHGLQPQFPHVTGLAGCIPDFRASQKARQGSGVFQTKGWPRGHAGLMGTLLGDGCVPSSSVDRLKPRGAMRSPQDSTVPIIELCPCSRPGQRAMRTGAGANWGGVMVSFNPRNLAPGPA